jgi:Rad3-related DNA helicase
VIICDYNYAFDPRVRLKRFFLDKGEYALLIDEAHNLPERARDMLSAGIKRRDFAASAARA